MSYKQKYTVNDVETSEFDKGAVFKRYKKDTKECSQNTLHTGDQNSSGSSEKIKNATVIDKKENPGVVGKSFADTFSFLKKTDLYELPPQPKLTEVHTAKNSNAIIVNSKQRGNPILKFVHNIPWEYGDIVADYEIGQTACAMFLSLRYHSLNPDYIHDRLQLLGNRYTLRILLVLVDIEKTNASLKKLAKISLLANCTLILAWSNEEAGRYLETFKTYENKPPDILQERIDQDYVSKMQDILTTVKSISKADVITLLSNFKSLKHVANASVVELTLCPGFGPKKAQRLYNALHEPFKRDQKKLTSSQSPSKRTSSSVTSTVNVECKLIKPGINVDAMDDAMDVDNTEENKSSSCKNTVEDKIKNVDSLVNKAVNLITNLTSNPISDSNSDDTAESITQVDSITRVQPSKLIKNLINKGLEKEPINIYGQKSHTNFITDEDYQELIADSDEE
ncbi:uncharacterized protein LOC101236335 isoform X1 [Hydra vulgaris]|uniref:uncharacterized protein LOC101236335 isoform X1 n=1 Tax=Hydra vulgaris TaxID=6087 RepID=UPI001F5F8C57|nr:DNA excision repair protein ERCC-1 [Hydra vulgaris]